jgi:hypothetical protein
MTTALSGIGDFLGSTLGKGVLTAGTAGVGLIQNLIANRQAAAKQKFVQDLITNPAKFNSLVAQTEQPVSQAMKTDISRTVDANMAERGLGSSPAIMADAYAQALAPAEVQQQQMAINSLLSRLGIYANQPTMPGVNVTPMLQALSMWKPGGSGGGLPPIGDLSKTGYNVTDVVNPAVDVGDFGGLTPPIFGGDTGAYSG